MSIDALVHHENERDSEQATVKDIYDAVIASRTAQDAADAAGGDDDVDDDADPATRPTRREALSAAATLQSFITTLGDSYACKLDALLATFGRQTQLKATNAMSDTTITDFFTRAT
ncbi:hypothetical protein B0H11DRAFT_2332840 [Mycena galericulata]|nr:hypothetical protein B0H11DRAFT_2332840 [Mycena galericulata]